MENVVTKIRRELIRSISRIDAWFDMDSALHDHRSQDTAKTVHELLADAMLANRYILQIIDEGRLSQRTVTVKDVPLEDYCAKIQLLEDASFMAIDFNFTPSFEEATPLPLIRREIREQLNRCLIHLEELIDGEIQPFETDLSIGEIGVLDAYQCFYLLAMHVRRCLEQLDTVRADYDRYAEQV